MELLKEGEDFPFQTADSAQSDLDLDEVTLAAKNAFGIKYLFAWQRIVIANILDSALGLQSMGEDTPCLQTDVPVGEDDIALQTDAPVEKDNISLQTTPSLLTDTPFEEDDAALQTTPLLQTEAPFEKDNTSLQTNANEDSTALQTTPSLLTDTPLGEDDTSLQTTATEDNTSLQPDITEEEASFFYRGRQIVLLPTGAGKSLCFLTPALLLKGPTLVIYPLLALMADQKRRMDSGGIESVIFRGGQSPQEREENFAKIKKGAKIIIANPEVLQNKSIEKKLAACNIQHIAIDEAHCVSEWGDSFRPSYLTLGKIIKEVGCKTVTAFTATASPQVLSRVSQVLFGGQSHIVRSDADRSNIRYNVIYAAAKKREAFRLALTEQKPLLIFCGTRAKSEDMARELALYMGSD